MPSTKGVSIEYLEDFNDRLFKGYEAVGVQLLVCTKDSPVYSRKYTLRMHAGDTVQFKYEIDAETWYGYLPGVGEGSFDAKLVRPKVREEWTLQDVAEYVVKPTTMRKENAGLTFVDTLRTAQRGQPYKGVFVQTMPSTTPFRSLVQSMALYIDRSSDEEDRFVWLDVFCSTQHEQLRTTSHAKVVGQISQTFTDKLLFVSSHVAITGAGRVASRGARGDEAVILENVEVRGEEWKVYVTKELVEGVAALLAHLHRMQTPKLSPAMYDAVFGSELDALAFIGGPLGGTSLKKGEKMGFDKGSSVFGGKKLQQPSPNGYMQKLASPMSNAVTAKKGKMAKSMDDQGGVYLGQQSLGLNFDFLGLGLGQADHLFNPHQADSHTELIQQDFIQSIMHSNESL